MQFNPENFDVNYVINEIMNIKRGKYVFSGKRAGKHLKASSHTAIIRFLQYHLRLFLDSMFRSQLAGKRRMKMHFSRKLCIILCRWWRQYTLLPWPDNMALLTTTFLTGNEERQRLMRRNIVRYVLLSYCMATRAVSFRKSWSQT